MYHLIELLRQSKVVKKFELLQFIVEEEHQLFYAKVILRDNSILYVREAISSERGSRYSYHWQGKIRKLIMRWDNAPHHRDIATYPHHKHSNGKVMASYETNLDKALQAIEKYLNK